MARDRRHHPRFPTSLPLRCTAHARSNGETLDHLVGRATDIGGGGLQMELPTNLKPAMPVTLDLATRYGTMSIRGEVVWMADAKAGPSRGVVIRHGLRFLEPGQVAMLPDFWRLLGEEHFREQ